MYTYIYILPPTATPFALLVFVGPLPTVHAHTYMHAYIH